MPQRTTKIIAGRTYAMTVGGKESDSLMIFIHRKGAVYFFYPLNEHVFGADDDGLVGFMGEPMLWVPTKTQLKSLAGRDIPTIEYYVDSIPNDQELGAMVRKIFTSKEK